MTNRCENEKIKDAIIDITDFIQSLIFIASIINTVMAPVIEGIEEVIFPEFINMLTSNSK